MRAQDYDEEADALVDEEGNIISKKAKHEVLCAPERRGEAHVILCKKHQADDPLTFLEVEVTSELHAHWPWVHGALAESACAQAVASARASYWGEGVMWLG